MRTSVAIGLLALGCAAVWCTAASAAVECTLSGSWRATNGDTLVLSGIDSSRGEGTFDFHPAFMPSFSLSGGYRVVGNQLQMRGIDSGNRPRNMSLDIVNVNGDTFTTQGHNKTDARPQTWMRTGPGCQILKHT